MFRFRVCACVGVCVRACVYAYMESKEGPNSSYVCIDVPQELKSTTVCKLSRKLPKGENRQKEEKAARQMERRECLYICVCTYIRECEYVNMHIEEIEKV
jgi:hypothetical protein